MPPFAGLSLVLGRVSAGLAKVPADPRQASLGWNGYFAASPFSGPKGTSMFHHLRRSRPFPYPREIAGSAMALLYLAGAATTLLTLVFPHSSILNVPLMLAVGGTAAAISLIVYLMRSRLPQSAYPWTLAAFTGIVSLLAATSGSASATVSFSFLYIWVVAYALLFFKPFTAATQIGVTAASYAGVVAWLAQPGRSALTASEPIILAAVIATTCAVVMWLSRAREHSEIDPLTLALNRRGLDRILHSALRDASATGEAVALAMIDVDHFKSINDRQGHAAGDQLLENLSRIWRSELRPGDTLGRIGGDEFVVVLPRCTVGDATTILERLRDASMDAGVTCSLGAALLKPGDSASLLLHRADTALYDAKRRGRGRVAWAALAM